MGQLAGCLCVGKPGCRGSVPENAVCGPPLGVLGLVVFLLNRVIIGRGLWGSRVKEVGLRGSFPSSTARQLWQHPLCLFLTWKARLEPTGR